ncbi:MAG: hypothetical protein V3U75_13140 [Methylococcaceae bacterium]
MDIFNERTTGYVNLAFKDEDGNAVAPDSATYTLHNTDANKSIINDRENTTISSPTASYDLELTPVDNAIQDDAKVREVHALLVKWVYNTDKQGKDVYKFAVENLDKVP